MKTQLATTSPKQTNFIPPCYKDLVNNLISASKIENRDFDPLKTNNLTTIPGISVSD